MGYPSSTRSRARPSTTPNVGSTGSNPASSAARVRELEMEERHKEREETAAERILEEKKLTEQRKLELEDRRLARVAEVNMMEYELRKLEQTRRTDRYDRQEGEAGENMELEWRAAGHPRQDTLVGRTKIFGDAMRHVLPKIPSETAEIPQFFETVEKLFVMYEVPDDLKSKLLIPVLTAQAKALVSRMSVECMGKYSELKRFYLLSTN